jgi:hypothetical protein
MQSFSYEKLKDKYALAKAERDDAEEELEARDELHEQLAVETVSALQLQRDCPRAQFSSPSFLDNPHSHALPSTKVAAELRRKMRIFRAKEKAWKLEREQLVGMSGADDRRRVQLNSAKEQFDSLRPHVGMHFETPEDQKNGLLVTKVSPGHCGNRAGLQRGDIVTHINQREVNSQTDFSSAMGAVRPGDQIAFQVRRNDKEMLFMNAVGCKGAFSRNKHASHSLSLMKYIMNPSHQMSNLNALWR